MRLFTKKPGASHHRITIWVTPRPAPGSSRVTWVSSVPGSRKKAIHLSRIIPPPRLGWSILSVLAPYGIRLILKALGVHL